MTPFWSAKVGAVRRLLLEALVIDVFGKEQPRRPLGDRRRLVVVGVGDAAPEAGDLAAVQVIGEGRVDVAVDGRHRVRKHRARQRIGVGAEIGLRRQVADGIVGEGLHRRGRSDLGPAGGKISCFPSSLVLRQSSSADTELKTLVARPSCRLVAHQRLAQRRQLLANFIRANFSFIQVPPRPPTSRCPI